MQEAEVAKIAGSIWKYTTEGQNRFGKHGVERFSGDPDDFYLLGFLRAHHGPDNTFMVANGSPKGLAGGANDWSLQGIGSSKTAISRSFVRPGSKPPPSIDGDTGCRKPVTYSQLTPSPPLPRGLREVRSQI
jgi:hypothetical protein